MSKSIMFKILCLVLAVVMSACVFAACGGGEGGSGSGDNGGKDTVTGETQTWGRYTILVPENMVLKGGNVLDENDPTIVSVKDSDNDLHYVMCTLFSEESCKSSVDSTKSINNGEDITIDINGVTWTGVKYSAFSSDGFSMYGKVDGEWVLASGFYHGYDSAITTAILGSLAVSAPAAE